MSLIALILLALFVGYTVGKTPEKLDIVWQQTIKWFAVLSSFVWLGAGFPGAVAVFLLYQSFFVASRNKAEGKPIWFIDEETWLGEKIIQYLGKTGGRALFFIELLLAFLILIL